MEHFDLSARSSTSLVTRHQCDW